MECSIRKFEVEQERVQGHFHNWIDLTFSISMFSKDVWNYTVFLWQAILKVKMTSTGIETHCTKTKLYQIKMNQYKNVLKYIVVIKFM